MILHESTAKEDAYSSTLFTTHISNLWLHLLVLNSYLPSPNTVSDFSSLTVFVKLTSELLLCLETT